MIRKSLIAVAAVASMTIAVRTPASARDFKPLPGGWSLGATIVVGSLIADSCWQYRWVENRPGELIYWPVNVCRWWEPVTRFHQPVG